METFPGAPPAKVTKVQKGQPYHTWMQAGTTRAPGANSRAPAYSSAGKRPKPNTLQGQAVSLCIVTCEGRATIVQCSNACCKAKGMHIQNVAQKKWCTGHTVLQRSSCVMMLQKALQDSVGLHCLLPGVQKICHEDIRACWHDCCRRAHAVLLSVPVHRTGGRWQVGACALGL